MIKIIILNILKYFDLFYQLKMFKFLKEKGFLKFEIFFDVGAHRGETIKLFTKNFKIEKIYSFEPSKINFDYLKKNLLNFSETKKNVQIITENFAFGDKNNDIKIKHLNESSSSTINEIDTKSKYFKKKSFLLYNNQDNKFYKEENTIQKKLCDYILDNNISKIDFLKIDTEGYEMKVLLGLEKEFKKISIIMFEHHFNDMIVKNYKFRDINNLLRVNNFIQIYKYKMPFRKTFEYIYVRKDLL
jgi:FkbM family methyltransferase